MRNEDGDDDMLAECDFSNAVQGKHFQRYWASRGFVEIDSDLRKKFPTAQAVNEALRLLLSMKRGADVA